MATMRRFFARWWLIVLSLFVYSLGILGFYFQDASLPLSELLYRPLQLFGGEFTSEPTWEPGQLNRTLLLARILAPIVLITAVVDLASQFITLYVRKTWQMAHSRRRVILLGFGDIGHALARKLNETGHYITVVDAQFDKADLTLAQEVGILLIEADIADPFTLDKVRLDRCSDIYVACGSDEVNIEIGAVVAQHVSNSCKLFAGPGTIKKGKANEYDPPNLWVHLSSTRLTADLGDASDLGFVRGQEFEAFSIKTNAARDLLVRARLTQRALDGGQTRVHLILFGLGDHGEALMIETLLSAFANALKPPKVTVLDRNSDLAKRRFHACYPRLVDQSLPAEVRPEIVFHEADLQTLDLENDEYLSSIDKGSEPATAYILSCGEDLVNLSAALRLETAMQRLKRRSAPIFSRQWDRVIGPGDIADSDPLSMIRTFGNVRVTTASFLDERTIFDHIAQELHLAYLEKNKSELAQKPVQQKLNQEWKELSPNGKRSNLRAVRQGAVHLQSFGLQWRGMDKGALPHISPDFGKDILDGIVKLDWQPPIAASIDGRLIVGARVEHARWMMERAIEGFQQDPRATSDEAPKRDNQQRWHTMMVPFEDLAHDDRQNDLTLLHTLVRWCAQHEGPPAHWKSTAELVIDDASIKPIPDLEQATELKLTLNGETGPLAVSDWELAMQVVLSWASKPQACRLHLNLSTQDRFLEACERPIPLRPHLKAFLDTISNLSGRKGSDSGAGIVIDVTRRFDFSGKLE